MALNSGAGRDRRRKGYRYLLVYTLQLFSMVLTLMTMNQEGRERVFRKREEGRWKMDHIVDKEIQAQTRRVVSGV